MAAPPPTSGSSGGGGGGLPAGAAKIDTDNMGYSVLVLCLLSYLYHRF
jgi:hypothetical protein